MRCSYRIYGVRKVDIIIICYWMLIIKKLYYKIYMNFSRVYVVKVIILVKFSIKEKVKCYNCVWIFF